VRSLPAAIATIVAIAFGSSIGTAQNLQTGQPDALPGIVGHVRNTSGQAISDVFVTALFPSPVPIPGRPLSPVDVRFRAITNQEGEYRLDHLPANQYYLVAIPHNRAFGVDRQPNRTGYQTTYYPNVIGAARAQPVVHRGIRPTTADITLAPARLAVVSGTVIGSDGKPRGNVVLGITHGDGLFGVDSSAVRLGPAGQFALRGISPGTYFLFMHESAWPPPRGEIPVQSRARVVVTDADVSNVTVAPIHMVRARGRVVVAAADAKLLPRDVIHIAAPPVNPDGNPGPQRPGTPREDLSFECMGWPGTVHLRIDIDATGWRVKAVRLNGEDITGKSFELVEGRDLTGLEIEIVLVGRRG